MRKIVHLTDLHLFTAPGARLRNVPTWEAWTDVWAHVQAEHATADLIVITGDIAHDEKTETYRKLRQHLGDMARKIIVLPGNHDLRAGLIEAFPHPDQSAERLNFAIGHDGWTLLGLDTHIPGDVHGRVGTEQLSWLRQFTARLPAQRTLLFMHHPPVSVASPWIDDLGLYDADVVRQAIKDCPAIAAVFCGHVHQETATPVGNTVIYTTPSTAFQFLPGATDFITEPAPQGYRVIEIAPSGALSTEVIRLPTIRFWPD